MGVEVRLTLLAIGLVLMSLGCIGETPPVKPQETTTVKEAASVQLITKDLAALFILSKSELPSGFELVEHKNEGNTLLVRYEPSGNYTEFLRNNPTYRGVLLIYTLVFKFNSISEAQKAFDDKDKPSDEFKMKLATDVIGDETSLYFNKTEVGSRQLNGYVLLFRERNIVSTIILIGFDTNMSEVIKYAKIWDKKIVGETPTTTTPATTTPARSTPAPTTLPPTKVKKPTLSSPEKVIEALVEAHRNNDYEKMFSLGSKEWRERTDVDHFSREIRRRDAALRDAGRDIRFVKVLHVSYNENKTLAWINYEYEINGYPYTYCGGCGGYITTDSDDAFILEDGEWRFTAIRVGGVGQLR